MEVKIHDSAFAHADYSTLQKSKFIKWVRTNEVKPLSFFTDNSLRLVNNSNDIKKIAWLIEPRSINNFNYDFIKKNHNLFDYVLTYDNELLRLGDKFVFYPHGGCWIESEDQEIHQKNKLISMILSPKRMTEGHLLRHEIIDKFSKLDVFGYPNRIDNKITALKDYAFSIVVENSKINHYFTEKLIDCFMTGTIPIYWGCPSIGDFFNTDGMIIFNNINELENILDSITFDMYKNMEPSIVENFEKAKNYLISEDWIYTNSEIFK